MAKLVWSELLWIARVPGVYPHGLSVVQTGRVGDHGTRHRGRDRAPTSPPRRRDLGLTGLGHRPPALDASSRSSLRSTPNAASSQVRRGVGAAHRRGGVCRTDRCGGLHCRSVPDGATAPRVATHPLFAPTPATSARTGWSSSTPTQTFWSSGLSTRLPGARASDLEVTPSCEQPARIGPQAAQCEGAAWIQALNPGRCVGLWRRDRYRLPLGLPRGAGGILQESVEQQSSGLE